MSPFLSMIDEHCLNFFDQTTQLRANPEWADVRAVLAERGVDASRVVLFGCDHAGGDDMMLWLALPDGSIAHCILRKEAANGRYASIVEWAEVTIDEDEELLMASRAASDPGAAHALAAAIEGYCRFRQAVCK